MTDVDRTLCVFDGIVVELEPHRCSATTTRWAGARGALSVVVRLHHDEDEASSGRWDVSLYEHGHYLTGGSGSEVEDAEREAMESLRVGAIQRMREAQDRICHLRTLGADVTDLAAVFAPDIQRAMRSSARAASTETKRTKDLSRRVA